MLFVASFAEAWIEILTTIIPTPPEPVASFAEAWIEIYLDLYFLWYLSSPPSRRRGLKSFYVVKYNHVRCVASFAEAWIEIRTSRNF